MLRILDLALDFIITAAVGLYLLVVIVDIAFSILRMHNRGLLPESRQAVLDKVLLNSSPRRSGLNLPGFLTIPSMSMSWPRNFSIGKKIRNRSHNLQLWAEFRLRPLDASVSVTTFGFTVVIGLLFRFDIGWEPLLKIFCWFALISVTLRIVSYIVGSLPERLRQSGGSPFATFLIVALFDALALLACILLLGARSGDPQESLSSLGEVAVGFFNVPGKLADIAGLSVAQIGIALLGAVYYIAYLKSMVNPKEFRRTGDDYRRLAYLAVLTGDYKKADYWLALSGQMTADSYATRARIALATGNFGIAADRVRQVLKHSGEDESEEQVFLRLNDLSTFTPMSTSRRTLFFKYLISVGVPDAVLSAAAITASIASDDREVFLRNVVDDTSETRYPLAKATLLSGQSRISAAQEVLAHSLPGSEIEELLRLLNQCGLVLIDPDTTVPDTGAYVKSWFEEKSTVVSQLAGALTSAPYRRIALTASVDLLTAHQTFLRRYGYSDEYPEGLAQPFAEFLDSMCRELAESEQDLARIQQLHADVYRAALEPGPR